MPDIAAQPYVKTFSRKQRKQEQKDERGFPKNKRAVAVPVTKANDGQRQRARGDQRACDLPPKRDAARIGKQQERVEKRNAVFCIIPLQYITNFFAFQAAEKFLRKR